MGHRRRTPGLTQKGDIWQIDKQIKGYGRLCESTGTSDINEAQRYLGRRLEAIRDQLVYGRRPNRVWRDAATKYLDDHLHKRSIARDAQDLKLLDPWIGDQPIASIHMGTLRPFILHRQAEGIANSTINRSLAVARRILNLAARLWRDDNDQSWLDTAPMIVLLPSRPTREKYPLDYDEERLLISHIPSHMHRPCLFKINTGTREQEVCGLRWEWEYQVPELNTSVFVIPGQLTSAQALRRHQTRTGVQLFQGTKNGRDRIVVLNRVAASIIDAQRNLHREWVFPYEGKRRLELMSTGWKSGRVRAAQAYEKALARPCPEGFARVRVHDLKHTFGRRLRAAGVSFEDRQDLLGHASSRVTTEYSAAEIGNLIDAANLACQGEGARPSLTLRRAALR